MCTANPCIDLDADHLAKVRRKPLTREDRVQPCIEAAATAHDPKPTGVMFNPLRPSGRVGNVTMASSFLASRMKRNRAAVLRERAADRMFLHHPSGSVSSDLAAWATSLRRT
jgi:hypothetical protein